MIAGCHVRLQQLVVVQSTECKTPRVPSYRAGAGLVRLVDASHIATLSLLHPLQLLHEQMVLLLHKIPV